MAVAERTTPGLCGPLNTMPEDRSHHLTGSFRPWSNSSGPATSCAGWSSIFGDIDVVESRAR